MRRCRGSGTLFRRGRIHYERTAGRRAAAPLLHDVRQFVCEQLASARACRYILTRGEDDVRADRVGRGVDCLCRSGGAGIAVDAHLTEVVAEAILEMHARVAIERLAGRSQHVVHDGRRQLAVAPVLAAQPRPLQARLVFLLLALVAAAAVRMTAAGALPLQHRRKRRRNDCGEAMLIAMHWITSSSDDRHNHAPGQRGL